MSTILAGDIGGTKCNLALFTSEAERLRPVFQRRLPTRNYAGFESLIPDFLQQAAAEGVLNTTVDAAGFGLAGVVAEGRLHAENLSWVLDVPALTRSLNLKNLVLLNDMIATALSLEKLPESDFVALNPQATPEVEATRCVIAAGTGLGEAILFWDGKQYRAAAAEGGHADFAPHNERETELLSFLRKQLPHVCTEEILSGRGFRRVHEFLDPSVRHASFEAGGDAASEIAQQGLAGSCGVCSETLTLWSEIYGAVAGNFALQTMARGGVYVAGGIATKILPRLSDGTFLRGFCGQGKLTPVLKRIPIFVVLNADAPLWGAAYRALASLQPQ